MWLVEAENAAPFEPLLTFGADDACSVRLADYPLVSNARGETADGLAIGAQEVRYHLTAGDEVDQHYRS